MKIYAVGASEEELARLREFCLKNGWDFVQARRFGRPSRDYPVQKVLDAFRQHKNIRATARLLEISPGTVQRILRKQGVLQERNRKHGAT